MSARKPYSFPRGAASIAAPLAAFAVIVIVSRLYSGMGGPSLKGVFIDDVPQGLAADTQRQILAAQDELAKAPDNDKLTFRLSGLYLQALRENADTAFYGRIESLLQRVDAREPDNPETAFLRATIAAGRHDFHAAYAIAKRLTTENPKTQRYYGVLVDSEVELGMYDDAVATLQTMADLRPDYPVLTRIAYLREIKGDVQGAIEIMETALSDPPASAENQAWGFSELARLSMGKYRKQAELYEGEALRAYPDFPPALLGMARIEAARGNLDKAREYAKKAADILPLPDTVAVLGDIEKRAGNDDTAEAYYTLVKIGYDRIAERGTNVELERARFLADHGLDLEENIVRARAVYADRPTIYAADTLAWALFRNVETKEARVYAQKALATGTQDAGILYHAGVIEQALGNATEARKLLIQAKTNNNAFSILEAPVIDKQLKAIEGL